MERQHWNTDSKYKQNQYNYQENHTYVSMQKKKKYSHPIVPHHPEMKRISENCERHT